MDGADAETIAIRRQVAEILGISYEEYERIRASERYAEVAKRMIRDGSVPHPKTRRLLAHMRIAGRA